MGGGGGTEQEGRKMLFHVVKADMSFPNIKKLFLPFFFVRSTQGYLTPSVKM